MRVAVHALVALALAAAKVAGAAVATEACDAAVHYAYGEPVEIEGALKSATGHFTYTCVALDKPVCVDPPKGGGDDDFGNTGTDNPVERIQMAGEASQQELPVGGRVKVKGTLFGAHTMWHAEEVLIDASWVDRQ